MKQFVIKYNTSILISFTYISYILNIKTLLKNLLLSLLINCNKIYNNSAICTFEKNVLENLCFDQTVYTKNIYISKKIIF